MAWDRRVAWAALWITALLVLTVLTITTDAVLVSSLGIVVVVAGLVSPPRVVLATAVVAVACAVLLVLAGAVPGQGWWRVGNVAIGSGLGIAAAGSRHLMLRRIRRLQERDAALLAALPDAVLLVDDGGRVSYANDASQALLAPGGGLVGHLLHDVVVHDGTTGGPCDGHCALTGSAERTEARARLGDRLTVADGRTVVVDWEVEPLDDAVSGGAVVVLRDAEERLAQERRVGELAAARQESALRQHYLDVLGRALRPPPPTVPGLEIAVAYRAAEDGAPTGGDLHEGLVLADGRLFLLVVDAAGHGVGSTRAALQVAHAARTLVGRGVALVDLARAVDDAAPEEAGQSPPTASFVAATVDPVTGDVEVAGAGHPPALVLRGDGRTEWLESDGRPVGYPFAGTESVARTGRSAVTRCCSTPTASSRARVTWRPVSPHSARTPGPSAPARRRCSRSDSSSCSARTPATSTTPSSSPRAAWGTDRRLGRQDP